MRISSYSALCLSVVVMACAKSADKVDSTAASAAATPTPAPAPPPAISLADVAGKWDIVATPVEGTDTSVTKSTLTATADTTGWTITLAGRKPITGHVKASGDSITSWSEPYESVRRKGVKVTTSSVYRLQGGKLVGMTTARYDTKGADSVLHLKIVGTKAP